MFVPIFLDLIISEWLQKEGMVAVPLMGTKGLGVNELIEIVKEIDLQTFSEIIELCASYENEE
ncbi:hypothetical protein NZ045_31730 [Bacillus sp. FSL L8-0287]|uniref:hypothetical protein n=1 Tax=Bacillus sp. FSL L8-0287 TaxID=2976835 RepID=UPI0030FB7CB8